ncbi:hypothetical protein [Dongshaea marina]|uniref:hypothetical protein n=1 Tax=Dongshaea marina TaxID=2047966 RepID=UPI000D3E7EF8|nr:hypothetical protein [Dongshaea marina]
MTQGLRSKKVIATSAVLLLGFSLVGCGGGDNSGGSTESSHWTKEIDGKSQVVHVGQAISLDQVQACILATTSGHLSYSYDSYYVDASGTSIMESGSENNIPFSSSFWTTKTIVSGVYFVAKSDKSWKPATSIYNANTKKTFTLEMGKDVNISGTTHIECSDFNADQNVCQIKAGSCQL